MNATPVALLAAAASAACLYALGTLGYAYAATHPRRKRLRVLPLAHDLAHEDISFRSHDGNLLQGWLILPAGEPKGIVVLCHGYPENRCEMLPYARFLVDAGFAALLFDFRALGESEGKLCAVGGHEVADLLGAVDYLAARAETAALPIGALGLSLGGAVSLMAAARDERLLAVVAEAAYASLDRAVHARCRAVVGPPGKFVAGAVLWWSRRLYGLDAASVAPIREIGRIAPRAVMLLQGRRDFQVAYQDCEAMYDAAGEPKELWLLPTAGHARCLRESQPEYAARVTTFFNSHLRRA